MTLRHDRVAGAGRRARDDAPEPAPADEPDTAWFSLTGWRWVVPGALLGLLVGRRGGRRRRDEEPRRVLISSGADLGLVEPEEPVRRHRAQQVPGGVALQERRRVAPAGVAEQPDREGDEHRGQRDDAVRHGPRGLAAAPEQGLEHDGGDQQHAEGQVAGVVDDGDRVGPEADELAGRDARRRTPWRRRSVPRRVQRTHAQAAAKLATRYMLSMSRWPPHSLWVACMAADAGPSRTTTQAKKVATAGDMAAVGGVPSRAQRDEQPGHDEARVGQRVGRLPDEAVAGGLAEVRPAADVGAEPALADRQREEPTE